MTNALWNLGRGTGVVTLVLLTLVMALGVATRANRRLPALPRFATPALHRNLSLLAVVLLAVHVGTLAFDPYAQLRLVDLVVPFLGAYRPLWLGLGTLTLDLLAALVLTSLLRTRLGPRAWRAVHWAAYAAWPLAVVHGLNTGTDAAAGWFRLVTAGCVLLTGAVVAWRLALPAGGPRRRGARGLDGAGTVGSVPPPPSNLPQLERGLS